MPALWELPQQTPATGQSLDAKVSWWDQIFYANPWAHQGEVMDEINTCIYNAEHNIQAQLEFYINSVRVLLEQMKNAS